MPSSSRDSEAKRHAQLWQRSLQRFFQLPTLEITIAVLVIFLGGLGGYKTHTIIFDYARGYMGTPG